MLHRCDSYMQLNTLSHSHTNNRNHISTIFYMQHTNTRTIQKLYPYIMNFRIHNVHTHRASRQDEKGTERKSRAHIVQTKRAFAGVNLPTSAQTNQTTTNAQI